MERGLGSQLQMQATGMVRKMRKNQKQLRISVGNPLVPGIYRRGDGINIVLHETGDVPCSVVLFNPESKKEVYRIPFRREMIFGHVKAMYIEGMQPEDYNYAFCVNGVIKNGERHWRSR